VAEIMSILSANYKAVGLSVPSKTAYVAVDPTLYQGTWSGTYPDKKTFKFTVSDVNGFRAQVKYQSGSTTEYQQVLIGNSSFRIGNSKFVLQGTGKALVANAVTDPVTGNTSLVQGNATLDT
jgi:hypothetical protein